MLTITLDNELRCPCGARRDATSKRCGKCRARASWYRRRAWRTNRNPNRQTDRKK